MNQPEGTTPGPWEVYEGANYVRVGANGYAAYVEYERYLGGPLSVADVEDKASVDHSDTHELAMKNAHLIASAPQLYEALELCLDSMVGKVNPKTPAWNAGRAALAHARGEK